MMQFCSSDTREMMQFCSSDTSEIGIFGNFCFPLFEDMLCSLVLTFFVKKVSKKTEKIEKSNEV